MGQLEKEQPDGEVARTEQEGSVASPSPIKEPCTLQPQPSFNVIFCIPPLKISFLKSFSLTNCTIKNDA